jgi:hypothetical protein
MLLREPNVLTVDQPKPGLTVMWGSAAWAQTQITPGVSALAAPLQMRRLAPANGQALQGASERN